MAVYYEQDKGNIFGALGNDFGLPRSHKDGIAHFSLHTSEHRPVYETIHFLLASFETRGIVASFGAER